MADFEALKGRPGPGYTGRPVVASRHSGPGGIWPAVIVLTPAAICGEGYRIIDVRLEMTPAEALKFATDLMRFAAVVD